MTILIYIYRLQKGHCKGGSCSSLTASKKDKQSLFPFIFAVRYRSSHILRVEGSAGAANMTKPSNRKENKWSQIVWTNFG